MKRYRVTGGTGRIGVGQTIGLTPEQHAAREHRVEVLNKTKQLVQARTLEPLDFKHGETLQLEEPPAKSMDGIIVPDEDKGGAKGDAKSDAKADAAG